MASVSAENATGYFRDCGYPVPEEDAEEEEEAVVAALSLVASLL
jgi:hypothetical protein